MVVTLLYSIAGGMLVVLATGRAEQIAWRFLRLVGALTFALACGATAWSIRTHGFRTPDAMQMGATICGAAAGVGAAAIVFIAPVSASSTRMFRAVCLFAGLCGLASCGLAALANSHQAAMLRVASAVPDSPTAVSGTLAAGMIVLSQILGALLLGSITVAWLLGHAYLTATKMTIAPLRHFSRMLSWSVAMRIAFLLLSVLIAWRGIGGASPAILTHLGQWWLIATLRVGVGLVAVAAFAYMVSDCVHLRSTQSATGILYFGSVMAYVGELASQQLVRELGWPI